MTSDSLDKPGLGKQRVVAVCLDMGDSRLIRNWSQAGLLPAFAGLMSSGSWLELDSTAKVLHTSSWPTFATGATPGRHGVYYPYQPKPGNQLAVHIQPDQYGASTFWQTASQAGARCLVYDVPETFPEGGFKGRAVFDWGTWAWYGVPASQPDGLINELKTKFGEYPLGYEAKKLGLRFPDPKTIEDRLVKSVDYKGRTLGWLMKSDAWDLTVVGFCETHPAGHYLWPAGVSSGDDPDPKRFGAIFNVYKAIDQAIGELAGTLPSDTVFMILSGDGVRANRCGWHLLGQMLEKLGFMNAGSQGQPTGKKGGSMIARARRLMPAGTKRWVADHLPWWLRDKIGAQAAASEINWAGTRAFPLPTDLEGCIRINLKGREPQGIVEPGAQYDDLCRELRRDLLALVNPASGAPAVRNVWIRNEVFPGGKQEDLPDLIVDWNTDAPFDSLVSPRAGSVEGASPDLRTGTHSPEAFLLATGPGVTAGTRGSGRLVDVAPTILGSLGVGVRNQTEGIPISLHRTIAADHAAN